MTADEAVNYRLNEYPGIYAATTLQNARNSILGHIFNTIGNGYNDHGEFAQAHQWTTTIAEMARAFPAKYIGPETVYTGYLKTNKSSSGKHAFDMVDINSALHGLYTEKEKEFHPDVTKWTANRKNGAHRPYPNFQKAYSLLYAVDIEKLDESWLKAGIEYYTYCREFFNGPQACDYHGAWPSNPQAQTSLVTDYTTAINRCIKGIARQEEQWDAISKAYGTLYKGDTPLFIQERWAKEKTRIEAFIDNTVGMLEQHLASRQEAAPTTGP